MKVLVLNCGSSSLKCQLIDMQTKERIMKGHYEGLMIVMDINNGHLLRNSLIMFDGFC